MSMEVKIIKEIKEYKETLAFGLTLRQCICTFLGVVFGVLVFFALDPILGSGATSYVCVITVVPFAALGFVKYNGMTAEKIAWAWLKSELLVPKRLNSTRSNSLYYEIWKGENEYGDKNNKSNKQTKK